VSGEQGHADSALTAREAAAVNTPAKHRGVVVQHQQLQGDSLQDIDAWSSNHSAAQHDRPEFNPHQQQQQQQQQANSTAAVAAALRACTDVEASSVTSQPGPADITAQQQQSSGQP